MDPNSIIQILSLIILIALSAFFSSSETALTTLSPYKVRQLKDKKVKNAGRVEKVLEEPSKMITTILVGNNIVNIGASAIATVFFTNLYGGSKGPILSTVVMTILVLIFGEITPKSLAQINPEPMALRSSGPILVLKKILTPLIYLLGIITDFLIGILGGKNAGEDKITKDEIRTIVDVSEEQGILMDEETSFINNVLDIKEDQALSIMTPRTSVSALDIECSHEDLFAFIQENNFSRIPVYRENIDHIVGILHLKDLVLPLEKHKSIKIEDYLHEPYFGYEYMPVIDLFRQMRQRNVSLSIIVDEYGGTSGIVSIEDIVEEFLGEIDDEYDQENPYIKLEKNHYRIDPELRIDEVNDAFDLNLESENYDSIGGWVMEQLERLPVEGDEVKRGKTLFIVKKMDKRKIENLDLILLEDQEEKE